MLVINYYYVYQILVKPAENNGCDGNYEINIALVTIYELLFVCE